MRIRAARLLLSLALLVLLVAFVLIWRARSQGVFGPAVDLCPGPDRYGYICEGGAAYAPIDAADATGLLADDAVITLDLPFPFTFYGATYTDVKVSTNGNLQFTTDNPLPRPDCLAPAAGMGDLIAPYWADLDLTAHGALETAVMGEAPARVFVVEWDDVPLYGTDSGDRVTFEVQLFETSNDIVFLYEDPTTAGGGNGGAAVAGIQSERQDLSLTYSCRQPVLPAPGGLRLAHPAEPNRAAGQPEDDRAATGPAGSGPAGSGPNASAPVAKEPLAELLAAYATRGPAALAALQGQWAGGRPARAFVWRAADLTGDGTAELVVAWGGGPGAPELTEVAVLAVDEGQPPAVLFDRRPTTRAASYAAIAPAEVADLTGDGQNDVVLRDDKSGATWVLSAETGAPALLDVPARCAGGLVVRDSDGDGRPELIRDGCDRPGRVGVVWDGAAFVIAP